MNKYNPIMSNIKDIGRKYPLKPRYIFLVDTIYIVNIKDMISKHMMVNPKNCRGFMNVPNGHRTRSLEFAKLAF